MIIVTDKSGRLGNKLHLFAHFIAFSLEHDVPIMFTGFAQYGHLFTITAHDALCRVPRPDAEPAVLTVTLAQLVVCFARLPVIPRLIPGTTHMYAYAKADYRDLSLVDISSSLLHRRLTFAHGYFFRHYDAVRKHADEIRRILSPNHVYQELADNFVAPIRTGTDILIGVHIRHGDYEQWQGGSHYFAGDQYAAIMSSLQYLFSPKRVAFVVCSDAEWRVEDFPNLNVSISNHEAIVDMQVLSRCDYLIGAKSSFNRWASFYGNVPLYVIRDPNEKIAKSSFRVNFLDDLVAILQD